MEEAGTWKRVTGVSLLILIVVYLLSIFLAIFGTGMLFGVFIKPVLKPVRSSVQKHPIPNLLFTDISIFCHHHV
jgi:hypothetical protein